MSKFAVQQGKVALVILIGALTVFGLVFGIVGACSSEASGPKPVEFDVIDDVVIRELIGRRRNCLVTIKTGGMSGTIVSIDACLPGPEGPLRWSLDDE